MLTNAPNMDVNPIRWQQYMNGINIVYGVLIFQEYLEKIGTKGYKITSNDLIKMQKFKMNVNKKYIYSPLKLFIKIWH